MTDKIKSILIRFLKGGIAGSLATITASSVILKDIHTWADLPTALSLLALSGFIGFISGVILAAEKWASWTE